MSGQTIGSVLDGLHAIDWRWPNGTRLSAIADPCRDGWLLRLAWGGRVVVSFVSYEAIYNDRNAAGLWVRTTDALLKTMAREVGGVGLGPVAEELLKAQGAWS